MYSIYIAYLYKNYILMISTYLIFFSLFISDAYRSAITSLFKLKILTTAPNQNANQSISNHRSMRQLLRSNPIYHSHSIGYMQILHLSKNYLALKQTNWTQVLCSPILLTILKRLLIRFFPPDYSFKQINKTKCQIIHLLPSHY